MIQLDKEPAIMFVSRTRPWRPAPQDNQLMSKHRVLSFKPQLRLEWRGQDGPNVTEQPNHSASSHHVINSDDVSVHALASAASNEERRPVSHLRSCPKIQIDPKAVQYRDAS
jgi:hypothetical protein